MNEISVIIPLGDAYNGKAMPERWEALEFSIRTFYGKHEAIELILVCQNVVLPDNVKNAITSFVSPNRSVLVIKLKYPVFNKGWCCNVGARAARYDYICIAEADMWAAESFLNKIVIKSWCIAWGELAYTSLPHRRTILKGRSLTRNEALEDGTIYVYPKKGLSEGGLVIFDKDFYLSIGGCNEWFEELGGPDNEIARRAEKASGEYNTYLHQMVYHLWHPKCRDKYRPTRKANKLLYQSTVRHPEKFNAFLVKQNFGRIAAPLIAYKTFKEAWNESH